MTPTTMTVTQARAVATYLPSAAGVVRLGNVAEWRAGRRLLASVVRYGHTRRARLAAEVLLARQRPQVK